MTGSARWWVKEGSSIRCLLCPHACLLSGGETGLCGVRSAGRNGEMVLPAYGLITASGLDPIEKKPLYHFLPGKSVWSVGFAGCNMDCPFCQNHTIARMSAQDIKVSGYRFLEMTAEETIQEAIKSGSHMIAYTYSEPTVHFEYLCECAETATKAGLKNVLVTNGMLNRKPARELLTLMDAVNIDLKAWSADYYRDTLGGDFSTVLSFIEEAVQKCWVELTTLIVPGENDSEKAMKEESEWIASLSPDIPLHLSAYHPSHRYTQAHRKATGWEILVTLRNLAAESLHYVYTGNIGLENPDNCRNCGELLIERRGFGVRLYLDGDRCPSCGTHMPGVF